MLRIAITADPELPVPPRDYGGIERIIDLLVRGLVKRGHEITLFAHPDSNVPCRLVPYPDSKNGSSLGLIKRIAHVSSGILRGRYNLIHSFGRLAYLCGLLPLPIPKIMSYQRPVTPRSVIWAERLSRGTLHFVGLSRHIVKPYEGRPNWHVIYNGASRDIYELRDKVSEDAPLVFLGRIEEIKGPHLAIEVARRTGRRLILAGNIPEGTKHQVYFREKIVPHVNGNVVRYIGPVTDQDKSEILGQAVALLMPVQWEEPFGIVMAEALACGTPVIGFNRGAVPEVIQNRVNGFVCESVEGMVEAVRRVKEINRKACRRIMEERFSDRSIVEGYERLYLKLLSS